MLTEVNAEPLVHTMSDVNPKALVGRLANMPDEVDVKTHTRRFVGRGTSKRWLTP